MPRALFDRGDTKAASVERDRIARRRPNLADLPEGMIMVDRGVGKFGWQPRAKQKDAWRAFDSLWWDVRDAQK